MKKQPATIAAIMSIMLAIAFSATANNLGKIGIAYSFNNNSFISTASACDNDASSTIKGANGMGVIYLQPLNHWLELETGLDYLWYSVETSSISTGTVIYSHRTASLYDVPVGARATFLKYFFANGGLIFDLNTRPGLGFSIGVGVKYDFKCGLSVFFNPYAKIHGFFTNINSCNNNLTENVWRCGITYQL